MGAAGTGGAGVVGAGLTIVNSGTISGGAGGPGAPGGGTPGAAGDAIALTGGSNNLTSNSGTLTGNIDLATGNSTSLTLLQTAAGGATGNAVISANITGAGGAATDASVTITTDSGYSVSLGGTNTYSGGTAVTAGTLVISNNSALGTGALTLDPSTTVNLAGVSIANTINVSGDPNITVTGASSINTISGTGTVNILGTSGSATTDVLTVNGPNSYTAVTMVGDGTTGHAATVLGGATNSFSATSATTVTANSILDLGGFAEAIGSATGSGTVTNSGVSSPAVLTIGGGQSTTFSGTIEDGTSATGLTLANGSSLTLSGTGNTYSGTTLVGDGVNASTLAGGAANSLSANSAIQLSLLGTLDLGGYNQTIFSLADGTGGSGTVTNSGVSSPAVLTIGGGQSTTFSGTIEDGTSATGLTLANGSSLTLSGSNTYTGATAVDGTLVVDGSISASSLTTVNNNGTLSGTGTIGNAQINGGGTFAPGATAKPGTATTVSGSLAFSSGAIYLIQADPAAATKANVTGTASLAGNVLAVFAAGGYTSKQYDILHSAGLGGTNFAGLGTTNLPAGFNATLTYSSTDAFLNLAAVMGGRGSSLSGNQQNIATSLNNFFNGGGALTPNFFTIFGLSGGNLASALSQLAGEVGTTAQTSAFQLMTDFLNLLSDPTAGGSGEGGTGGPQRFAPDDQASLPPDIALAYAHALHQEPPPASQPQPQDFDQRWSAWASGFGGSNTTDGNSAVGSSNVTATNYGYAVGVTYHATPSTSYGFALAGGGTNWSVAQNLGTGRSDAFQAGVYGTTHFGPAYLSGALAFANHWFTTNRIAVGDQLTAQFQGQSYAARGEAGYRYAVPVTGYIIGVTPYAALQAQNFHTPGYSEADLTGGGFGLTYGSVNTTDTRSELGARFDNLTIWDGMPLVLRGRLAWAHDWVANPVLGAVFQALPGSNFTLNGAAPPANSALTTAAAELHLTSNWTAMAKFDGGFGAGSQTYAGTGTLRYSW